MIRAKHCVVVIVATALAVACGREHPSTRRASARSLHAECFTRTKIGVGRVIALDDAGRVLVNDSEPEGEPGSGSAFVWQSGVVTRLRFPEAMKFPGAAYDINVAGMNRRGEVLGIATAQDPVTSSPSDTRIFVWRDGVPQEVPAEIPGPRDAIQPIAINDVDDVVVRSEADGFLLRGGVTIPLGIRVPSALNEAGVVVGGSSWEPSSRAYVWRDGVRVDLGSGTAVAVNGSGDIVRVAGDASFFHGHSSTERIGTLGGDSVFARASNERGDVVGGSSIRSGIDAPFHAFLWTGGAMHDLGVPAGGESSDASDINERGVIVGAAARADGKGVPVVWDHGTSFVLPYEQPWEDEYFFGISAHLINEHDVIAGSAEGGDGSTMSYVWTPDRCPAENDAGGGGTPAEDAGAADGFVPSPEEPNE